MLSSNSSSSYTTPTPLTATPTTTPPVLASFSDKESGRGEGTGGRANDVGPAFGPSVRPRSLFDSSRATAVTGNAAAAAQTTTQIFGATDRPTDQRLQLSVVVVVLWPAEVVVATAAAAAH